MFYPASVASGTVNLNGKQGLCCGCNPLDSDAIFSGLAMFIFPSHLSGPQIVNLIAQRNGIVIVDQEEGLTDRQGIQVLKDERVALPMGNCAQIQLF